MPGAEYFRKQAAIFERVAVQCTIPELVGYYAGLAGDYRGRADAEACATLDPNITDDGTA